MNMRPATLQDREAVLNIAREQANRYPLRQDHRKMSDLFTDAVSSPRHLALVVENEDGVQGALVAFVTNNSWAQRMNAAVLLWVSKIPGAGATMLRAFRGWVKSRRAIKVAGFSPDIDVDPRVWMLAEKIGFKRYGSAYLLYN